MPSVEQQEIDCWTVLRVLLDAHESQDNPDSGGWMTAVQILEKLGRRRLRSRDFIRISTTLDYLRNCEGFLEYRLNPSGQTAHAKVNEQYRIVADKKQEIVQALASSRPIVHHRRKRHLRKPK